MSREREKVTSIDIWRTEKAGYSVEEFYTRSKDNKGHSTVYHIRLPDDVAGELPAIIQSGKIPAYRTTADIWRDALIHRLHWLSENFEALPNIESVRNTITRIAVENNTLRYTEEITSYNRMLQQIQTSCDLALEARDLERLSSYLTEQRELVEEMREPFRSRAMELLKGYEEKLKLLSGD